MEAGRIGRPKTTGYGTVGRSGFTARTRSASLTAVVLTLPRGVSLCRDSGLYARPPTLGPVSWFPCGLFNPPSGRLAGAAHRSPAAFFRLGAVFREVSPGGSPGVFGATPVTIIAIGNLQWVGVGGAQCIWDAELNRLDPG